jgi:hypothetical protein
MNLAAVEGAAGQFPTFTATQRSHANTRGNGNYPFALALMALEEHSAVFHTIRFNFAHGDGLRGDRD